MQSHALWRLVGNFEICKRRKEYEYTCGRGVLSIATQMNGIVQENAESAVIKVQ